MHDQSTSISLYVGVFAGLLATIITNIVNAWMASKDRKLRNDISKQELEQAKNNALSELAIKEKIEYHKMAVEHLMNKAKYLNEWNIKFEKIYAIEALYGSINSDNTHLDDTLTKIKELMVNFNESIAQLSIYLPEQKINQLLMINDKCEERMNSVEGLDDVEYKERNSIYIQYLKDCRNLIRAEIALLVKQIDELIKKYLE